MVQSNTIKVTISGSFKTAGKDIESFENVVGIMPRLDDDKVQQMVVRRYAKIWVGKERKRDANGKFTDEPKYRFINKIRQVFIDSVEDNDEAPDAVLSYVGKNIMDMNFEELQDLAAAKDLSRVPLYKVNSLVHARRVAWAEYATKVLGAVGPEFDNNNAAFHPNKHEPIIADAVIRRDGGHVATIEETIDRENLAMQGKAKANVTDTSASKLTLENLKAIADEKKINYHKNISYDALFAKLYGPKKAA